MLQSLVTEPWEENYVYANDFKMLHEIKDVLLRVDQSCKIRIEEDPKERAAEGNTRCSSFCCHFCSPTSGGSSLEYLGEGARRRGEPITAAPGQEVRWRSSLKVKHF